MKVTHLFSPVTSKVRGFLFSPYDEKKHIVAPAIVLVGLVALAVGGCRPEVAAPQRNEPTAIAADDGATAVPTEKATESAGDNATASPPPSSASLFPQTRTDALEREVTIENRPQRIVSLAPAVTEILYAIGAGPQVVGRTEYDNYPPEVASLPSVGGFTADSISVETILALEPDLVLGGDRQQEEIASALEGSGIPVYVTAPETLAEIEASILTLGEITGNEEGAEAVVGEMQSRMAAVAEKVEAIPTEERLTVFYEVWHEPLMTASNATYIGELVEQAGGSNIFGGLEESYPTVSAEQIITLNPQAIAGPSSHGDQLTAEAIAARPGWENLAAVQNGAIYILDGDPISRPGPRVVEALEQLAAFLYPEVFSE